MKAITSALDVPGITPERGTSQRHEDPAPPPEKEAGDPPRPRRPGDQDGGGERLREGHDHRERVDAMDPREQQSHREAPPGPDRRGDAQDRRPARDAPAVEEVDAQHVDCALPHEEERHPHGDEPEGRAAHRIGQREPGERRRTPRRLAGGAAALHRDTQLAGRVAYDEHGREPLHQREHDAGQQHRPLPPEGGLERGDQREQDAADPESDGDQTQRRLAPALEPSRRQPVVGGGQQEGAPHAHDGPRNVEMPELRCKGGRDEPDRRDDGTDHERAPRSVAVHVRARERPDGGRDRLPRDEGGDHGESPDREAVRDGRDVDGGGPEDESRGRRVAEDAGRNDDPAVVERRAPTGETHSRAIPPDPSAAISPGGPGAVGRASSSAIRSPSIATTVNRWPSISTESPTRGIRPRLAST